jgi:hypothetical protein
VLRRRHAHAQRPHALRTAPALRSIRARISPSDRYPSDRVILWPEFHGQTLRPRWRQATGRQATPKVERECLPARANVPSATLAAPHGPRVAQKSSGEIMAAPTNPAGASVRAPE